MTSSTWILGAALFGAAPFGAATIGCSDSSGDDNAGAAGSPSTGGSTSTGGSAGATGSGGSAGVGGSAAADFDATAADFECLKDWTPVRRFFITNKLGLEDETLAVANSPTGGVYPPGTIIQLVPQEAMIKRGAGFSPETKDWEFFKLGVDAAGTTINERGTTEITGDIGGISCATCHAGAEPQWDFVCEEGHGCIPLGLTTDLIRTVQDADPRCQ